MGEWLLGIDPGLKGGCCLLDSEGEIQRCIPMPLIEDSRGKNRPDINKILEIIEENIILNVFIEAQGMRPHDSKGAGSTTMVNFGFILGGIEGFNFCHRTKANVTIIQPQTWMAKIFKMHGISNKDSNNEKREKKTRSFELGKKLYPEQKWLATARSRVPHDGMCESALIAYYGSLKMKEKI